MFARAADTLVPATAPGVTSYADPAFGRELRLRVIPGPATSDDTSVLRTLHDGGVARATGGDLAFTGGAFEYTPGGEYDLVTFDVLDPMLPMTTPVVVAGATPLPGVADEASLLACASPGCYLLEPGRLRVRLHTRDAPAASVSF
jgi:hypothetical protein